MLSKIFDYKRLPITILLLYSSVFFYARAIYLYFNPKASYTYFKVHYHPHEKLLETVVIYTLIMLLFIFGFSLSRSILKNKLYEKTDNLFLSPRSQQIIKILFAFSVGLAFLRSIVFGMVAGNTQSQSMKYIFFIYWLIPLNLVYMMMMLNDSSLFKKSIYTILYIFSVVSSGMKGGLIQPIVIIFYLYVYKNKKIKISYFLYIIFSLVIAVLLFPFVFEIVSNIRSSGKVEIISFFKTVSDSYKNYTILLSKIINYIFYRLSLVEYLQTILQDYSSINRDEINIITMLIHIYNSFVPSFLESDVWYYKFTGNKIFPILFFGMNESINSSEALTIPGFLVFYTGILSPIFSVFFGFFFGMFYQLITDSKNIIISHVFGIYINVTFFTIIQSGSIEHASLVIKEFISFYLLLLLLLNISNIVFDRC